MGFIKISFDFAHVFRPWGCGYCMITTLLL